MIVLSSERRNRACLLPPPPKVFTGTRGNDFIKIGPKTTDAKNIEIRPDGGNDRVLLKSVTGKNIKIGATNIYQPDADKVFITQSTGNVIEIRGNGKDKTIADKTSSNNTYIFVDPNKALIEGNQNTIKVKAEGTFHITGDSNLISVRGNFFSFGLGDPSARIYVGGVGNRLDIRPGADFEPPKFPSSLSSPFQQDVFELEPIPEINGLVRARRVQLDLFGQGMQVMNDGVIATGDGDDEIKVGGSFDTRPVTFKTGGGNDTIQFYDGAKGSFVVEKGAEKVTLPDSYKEQDRQGDYRVFQNPAGDATVKVEQSIPVEFASNAAPPEPPAPPFDVTADFS